MHVMHVMASLSRSGAGVYEAVLGATRAFVQSGAGRVTIVGAIDTVADWPQDRQRWEQAGVDVFVVPRAGLLLGWACRMAVERAAIRSVDIVHGHGLWCGASSAAACIATRLECPLVISPHGMLEPWARRHHRHRKRIAWVLAERAGVGRADLLQAMSASEAVSFRTARLFQPVVVHPVGIDIPVALPPPQSPVRLKCVAVPRTCLFLSRLHPIKGLPLLLDAWGEAQPAGWRLVVAGPDQHGHRAAMASLANRLGIDGSVAFVGPLHGPAKWNLLADADLFVLPSHSENFGVVIAEALAAGTPVITTTSTPWDLLPASGAGWWVPPDVASLAAAVREATSLPPSVLRAMGECGRELARSRCDWSAIAAAARDTYWWLLHGGPAPSAVKFAEHGVE
jgi:glycosyltransferase involved in cell wall biosynthesis